MTGGKKKRNDIKTGLAESEKFTNQAVKQQQPFYDAGTSALAQLQAASGLGTPEQQAGVSSAFENSPWYTGATNAFSDVKDRVNDSFAGQGLAFSGANMAAKEKARQDTYQNAFNSFLTNTGNIAGMGSNAANTNSSLFANQGQNALNAYGNIANTRQGIIGGMTQFGNALNTLFPQRTG